MPDILGICPDCKTEVCDPESTRNTKSVQCNLCNHWYHGKSKCQNVEDLIYKAINSDEGKTSLYWVCSHCFKPGRGIIDKMAEIVNKLNNYEDRIKTLENKEIETISPESVNEYEDRIKALENKEVEKSNTIKTYASAAVNKYFKDNPVQKQ